jgi:hypothetical protein
MSVRGLSVYSLSTVGAQELLTYVVVPRRSTFLCANLPCYPAKAGTCVFPKPCVSHLTLKTNEGKVRET